MKSGNYSGKSSLHLPWLEPGQVIFESESTLALQVGERVTTLTYTWDHEGPQHGAVTFVVDPENGQGEAAFADSWHQNGGVLSMKASRTEAGLSALGSYSSEEHGTWGWRIDVSGSEAGVRFQMTNIDPADTEYWAVEANYSL